MGSVKDLVVLKQPTVDKTGLGELDYSDRYSVFDWGKMPDPIPYKGASLCSVSAHLSEEIGDRTDIKTHYKGVVYDDAKTYSQFTGKPASKMVVDLVRVIKPEIKNGKYDYSAFQRHIANYLIPLEIIYRNGLPEGSSAFRRIQKGELTPEELGVEKAYHGMWLPRTFFDVSTKL